MRTVLIIRVKKKSGETDERNTQPAWHQTDRASNCGVESDVGCSGVRCVADWVWNRVIVFACNE